MRYAQTTYDELTYAEIAEEIELVFGEGSVGIGTGECGKASEIARATFVGACVLLVVKQRCDIAGLNRREQADRFFQVNRRVRRECSALLGIDENETFRLHHHAAGLRAKDPAYRKVARTIERQLAKRYGMEV